jgi:hypothetical protein
VASLAVAWHLGTVRSWSVAPRVRARSFALVFAVASVLATGSIVAAAAVRVAVPDPHQVPPAAAPGSDVSSAPIVDGQGLDGPEDDATGLPSVPPAHPGTVETELTANPSPATDHDAKHPADGAAGTTRSHDDAGDDDHDATDSHDGTGGMDSGGRDGGDDTERHDGSGTEGGHSGGADDGQSGGTDGGGRD